MWLKWFPWRFIVRQAALRRGFVDPIALFSRFQNFAQPSDVLVPTELLRVGAVIHARGLMNSQAIQHNLDWIWPYWVERQFDPKDQAFIPRAFSITQINLTHRNWTALGIPDCAQYPLVDPRGLLTPLFDGWSLDAWILTRDRRALVPSRLPDVSQKFCAGDNLAICTKSQADGLSLSSQAQVIGNKDAPWCQMNVTGTSDEGGWLAISLRPYNAEGVSFIHDVELLDKRAGWLVNKKDFVYFDNPADQYEFSYYRHGDVYSRLPSHEDKSKVFCTVGMATAAALFKLQARAPRTVMLHVPLYKEPKEKPFVFPVTQNSMAWEESLRGHCQLKIPDEHFKFLYDTALRTLILHSPKEVYPGPYTYRRFWFRDAAFILYAMLCAGMTGRVQRALDDFPGRQNHSGYFFSQEGEWDSNGEALWIMRRFSEMTLIPPKPGWLRAIDKGALWISRKRLPPGPSAAHAGLLPAGFSAEHLGPNDYYYWDDFWGIAGLKAAAYFGKIYGNQKRAQYFEQEAEDFLRSVKRSLTHARTRLGCCVMPAAPYRRLDTGTIGSLVAGYPLQIFSARDPEILDTVDYLLKTSLIKGGFFHDLTHSGINPYLTLHIAQALLRAGDPRYWDLMKAVAALASSTGQWPEAVHPGTGGGCMGDGQHVWAAAEWVLMIRNCFLREEEKDRCLILCSGIPDGWLQKQEEISFGPAPTLFGPVYLTIQPQKDSLTVSWTPRWLGTAPNIEVHLPGYPDVKIKEGQNQISFNRGKIPCASS